MKILLGKLMVNYPYVVSIILFSIGALIVLNKTNLFKKLIGINIMESSIFIMFVAAGNIRGGAVPLYSEAHAQAGVTYINPLPSALMLTGIVVSVSVTAFALALIFRLYRSYGTTDVKKIAKLRKEVAENDIYD